MYMLCAAAEVQNEGNVYKADTHKNMFYIYYIYKTKSSSLETDFNLKVLSTGHVDLEVNIRSIVL